MISSALLSRFSATSYAASISLGLLSVSLRKSVMGTFNAAADLGDIAIVFHQQLGDELKVEISDRRGNLYLRGHFNTSSALVTKYCRSTISERRMAASCRALNLIVSGGRVRRFRRV